MKRVVSLVAAGVLLVGVGAAICLDDVAAQAKKEKPAAATPDWTMKASTIEACSCPMFCQCYFNTKPAAHSHGHGQEEHFCRFNNAFQISKGNYGAVKLDGAKFWVAGDLGDSFADAEMEWARIHFDPAVTEEQRAGIAEIVGKMYPVKWKDFSVGEDKPIEWNATKDKAVAKLDGGKAAEVVLTRFPGMTDEPIVISNLKYWGLSRHDGFVLMPHEVEAYRLGDRAFEFNGGNGFMLTFDFSSKDVAAAGASKGN